ncbi:hypothetical protein CABS03_13645 [Colletotrichum abscissum]|uniref:Uncharacterized protein n=1 Tax=Colletotrichum abscissum TaxID=1671311 RepID=A0A9Q0B3L4_9PEZI|nr:hypothetical protein CABS02_09096 [Colletotrichum abscissum]
MPSVPPVKIEPGSAKCPRARCGPERGEVRLMGGFLMQEKEMRERRRRKWESREKAAEASRGCNVCNRGPKWMRQARVVELGSCDSACRVELSARGGTPSPW